MLDNLFPNKYKQRYYSLFYLISYSNYFFTLLQHVLEIILYCGWRILWANFNLLETLTELSIFTLNFNFPLPLTFYI